MNGIEQRFVAAEMRVGAEGTIEGYAAVFGQWSEDLGGFREKIRAGAFTKTIQEGDIRALFNHDSNYVLGRNKAGTLELAEDDHGLAFIAKPPETQWANDLRESIRRGDIDQASFGFQTVRDKWEGGDTGTDKRRQRELIEVRLYDVSVVTFPAYPQTQVSARSLAEQFLARLRWTEVMGEDAMSKEIPEIVEFIRSEMARFIVPLPALDLTPGPFPEGKGGGGEDATDAPGQEPHPEVVELKRQILKLKISK